MDGSRKDHAGAQTIRRIKPNGPDGTGLAPWDAMDPAALASGTPVQSGYLYDEDEERGYSAGVWHCTPFDDMPGPYPVDEYMFLLEGQVVMALPDGQEITIHAGEAFILPQGLQCQWKMPQDVRKIFMIVENDGRTTSMNPSLKRVTTPTFAPLAASADAVQSAETVFASADGQMQVIRRQFPHGITGPVPSASQRIITVLSGEVQINTATFGENESFFADAQDQSDWTIAAGTTWIEARHRHLG